MKKNNIMARIKDAETSLKDTAKPKSLGKGGKYSVKLKEKQQPKSLKSEKQKKANKIETKDMLKLQDLAMQAHYEKAVIERKIAEEKLLQNQLHTKEQYKEYISIDSLAVYFKLIEKIAKDTYIKIHSILPEVIAYAKQNNTDELEQFMLREIKNIFETNIIETKKEINKDGFSF